MSEHFFGLWDGAVSDTWVDRAETIAQRHDARVVPYQGPEGKPRGWMACANRGAPFDAQTARAVLADLSEARLWNGAPVDATPDHDLIGAALEDSASVDETPDPASDAEGDELDDESIDEREWKETPTPGHYADNPWARVMEAARRGRGILLYPGEVERLSADADFARRARERTQS